MTKQHQEGPCFITDGPPSSDLPIPPHRTMNLPQILAGLTDDELAAWSGSLADVEREKRINVVGGPLRRCVDGLG